MKVFAILAAICGLLVLTSPTFAREQYPGQFAASKDGPWFRGLKNKNGTSCCNESDCHREKNADGTPTGKFRWRNAQDGEGYEIQMTPGGSWVKVPEYAVNPDNADNPSNGALACFTTYTIYCFVPPKDPDLPSSD
jgi:hypothetical protein